jgi:DNA polymerase I-like protein with 3'-5' exonuclease and polymerase domains
MEDSIEFKVPSVVDVGLGKSWGDAKWVMILEL